MRNEFSEKLLNSANEVSLTDIEETELMKKKHSTTHKKILKIHKIKLIKESCHSIQENGTPIFLQETVKSGL